MPSLLRRLNDRVRSIGNRRAFGVGSQAQRMRLSDEEFAFLEQAASGHPHPRARWSKEEKLNDLARAETWDAERTIRAWVIEALLLGERDEWSLHHRGIHLVGAKIEGELDLSFTRLSAPVAMNYCHFDSPIKLRSASIPVFELKGSRVDSLDARRVSVAGEVLLEDVHTVGPLAFTGARIGGDLDARGANLESNRGDALNADGAHVAGNINLFAGFRARGRVSLHGARVGGQLNCHEGHFLNCAGDALNANAAELKVGMFLSGGFTATGRVLLRGAHIGGELNCEGGRFINPNDVALAAERADIDRSALLSENFCAKGAVLLRGVRIGGQLICTRGKFTNNDGVALTADGLDISGDLLLDDGFTATGEVRLVGSHVGASLVCTGGTFSSSSGTALRAADMTVDQLWALRGARFGAGVVSVVGASINYLDDDVNTWPAGWRGDGFVYRDFGANTSTDVAERLRWLANQDGQFRPGPYTQLAAVYRRRGDVESAREVLIQRERCRTKSLTLLRRLLHRMWGAISAYGYKPWRAIGALAVVIVAVGFVFANTPPEPLATNDRQVMFVPLVYAVDLAIPIVDFRQASAHQPSQLWTQWVMWSTIAVGWVLSLAFVTAATGLFKQDE